MGTAGQHTPGRRALLRAAVATGAVTAAAGAVEVGTAGAARAAGGGFDAGSPRFTLAVLPDTQYLFDADSADPAPLKETFRYLVAERADANIAFLAHLGDVTEHGTEDEMSGPRHSFRQPGD
ncbi:Calcineurin-like phosphoesterase domain-containing protein OS=Streptomyces fumanus OX=67302 GN=GCM10018772_18140 PE=4 SV=1 [Streptomyces fumanus]